MKKIIILSVIVLIILSGFGGIAYAHSTHDVVKGDKLVGIGFSGKMTLGQKDISHTITFRITNPDGENTINLEKLSIINSDGTLIYDGPFIQNRIVQGEVQSEVLATLEPHNIVGIALALYFPCEGEDPHNPTSWKTPSEATQSMGEYTVEVVWSARGDSCPLIGQTMSYRTEYEAGTTNLIWGTAFATPMWNLKQK